MICHKCKIYFPRVVEVDGKKRNLQKRKFCLDCSPFNKHNTRNLIGIEKSRSCRFCNICNKQIFRKNEKGKVCWTCANRIGRTKKLNYIKNIVGESCWVCGYSKCWQALEFHHIDPKSKSISLTTREMQLALEKIINEIKKCILVCANCHREIHAGYLNVEFVQQLYQTTWEEIASDCSIALNPEK